MSKPRTLILRTAGTNCDRETAHAFERAGSPATPLHVDRVLEDPEILRDYRILVFPGGFTYGDDLGAGTILANRIRAALLEPIREMVGDGGLVLGICNGFQILVKTGLLPALGGHGTTGEATLTFNDSNRFEDRWVHMEAVSGRSPFIEKGDRLLVPVAHAEGKFVARDDDTVKRLESNRQVVFRYVDREGNSHPKYPDNPNGSKNDIAGICDPTGRILGLMPHPERNLEPFHHPRWTRDGCPEEGDGFRFFRNAVSSVE